MTISAFTGEDFVSLFPQILKTILESGQLTSPRSKSTLEASPLVFQVRNPRTRFFDSQITNYPSIILKQVQWISGSVDIQLIQKFDPRITKLVDPHTGLYDGAYGPIIRPQLDFVYRLLLMDSDTRRAIVSIFDVNDQRDGLDIPTTLSLQFLLRKRKLDMITYMRSNDVWGGLPTDVHLFCFIQEVVASWLGVELGEYTHIAGSGHIYDDEIESIKNWLDTSHISQYRIATPPAYESSFDETESELLCFQNWLQFLSNRDPKISEFPVFAGHDPYLRWGIEKIEEYYKD